MSTNAGTVLSPDETMAAAIMTEVARCLFYGKPIDLHFKPLPAADRNKLVLCKWMRSGALKFVRDAGKKFQHATTIEEAIAKRKSFTCTMELYRELPTRRQA